MENEGEVQPPITAGDRIKAAAQVTQEGAKQAAAGIMRFAGGVATSTPAVRVKKAVKGVVKRATRKKTKKGGRKPAHGARATARQVGRAAGKRLAKARKAVVGLAAKRGKAKGGTKRTTRKR